MEDLDPERVIPGCADRILRALEGFGLCWDGEVTWQSQRGELYRAALEALAAAGRTFECSCTRRELIGNIETGYPGTCRSGPSRDGPTATRLRIDDSQVVTFEDRAQGSCRTPLRSLGDFVIKRKDGSPSYQLAVVVDDADQHVTDIVRGADLLDSTPWQMVLQDALGLDRPRYAHLPLIVEDSADKLSKSRRAVPVDPAAASTQLALALSLLNHRPPAELHNAGPGSLLEWAVSRWSLDAFHGCRTVPVPAHFSRQAAHGSQ
jgi:glutamyl-Q tRNA(Asp) synthetase